MTQTTVSMSEALKDHLRDVRDNTAEVSTLHGALLYLLDNPYSCQKELDGYDATLNDPIKVPEETLETVKKLRNRMGARDYEAAIRRKTNIVQRDVGEEPIEFSGW